MNVGERLLAILDELVENQLRAFIFHLSCLTGQDTHIPRGKLSNASRVEVAELLMQYYPDKELEVTAEVLHKIPRMDLLERYHLPLGETGTAGRGPPPPPRTETPVQAATGQPSLVSEKELIKIARKMGRNWRQIGIEFLDVKNSRLEQIEEENRSNEVMRAFHVLLDWKNREKERATRTQLYGILSQKVVPLDPEAYEFLKENA